MFVFVNETGTEAMFADLGHFNVPAIQVSSRSKILLITTNMNFYSKLTIMKFIIYFSQHGFICHLFLKLYLKFIIELQMSFSGIVFPALITAYIGQAAYLRKFPGDVADTFYKSCPGKSSFRHRN